MKIKDLVKGENYKFHCFIKGDIEVTYLGKYGDIHKFADFNCGIYNLYINHIHELIGNIATK